MQSRWVPTSDGPIRAPNGARPRLAWAVFREAEDMAPGGRPSARALRERQQGGRATDPLPYPGRGTAGEASRAASRVGLRSGGKLRRAALRYAARAGPPAPPSRPRGVGEAPTPICNRHPTTREAITVHSIHVTDLPRPKAVGYSAQSRLGRVLRRSRSNSGIDPSRRSDSHGRTLYEPVCALLLK